MSEPEIHNDQPDQAAPATQVMPPTAPEPTPEPQESPSPATRDLPVLAALIGDGQACRGAARALARQGARARVLCADRAQADALRTELSQGADRLDDEALDRITTVIGRLDSDSELASVMEGATGVALLSPVGPEGRTWRPATHLEDLRSILEAVSNRRIERIVYLSSVSAGSKLPVRCLREAAEAEKLIEDAKGLDFLLRTGPLIGRGDPWLTPLVRKAANGCPIAVVHGYGDTLFQPIHEDDLGACVARCFVAPANELHPGVYTLASTPPVHVIELLGRAATSLGRWPKLRVHLPLFVMALNLRLKKILHRDQAWAFGDRLGLLRCGLVAEKNEMETLIGPACSPRPLTNALEEAVAAAGLAKG